MNIGITYRKISAALYICFSVGSIIPLYSTISSLQLDMITLLGVQLNALSHNAGNAESFIANAKREDILTAKNEFDAFIAPLWPWEKLVRYEKKLWGYIDEEIDDKTRFTSPISGELTQAKMIIRRAMMWTDYSGALTILRSGPDQDSSRKQIEIVLSARQGASKTVNDRGTPDRDLDKQFQNFEQNLCMLSDVKDWSKASEVGPIDAATVEEVLKDICSHVKTVDDLCDYEFCEGTDNKLCQFYLTMLGVVRKYLQNKFSEFHQYVHDNGGLKESLLLKAQGVLNPESEKAEGQEPLKKRHLSRGKSGFSVHLTSVTPIEFAELIALVCTKEPKTVSLFEALKAQEGKESKKSPIIAAWTESPSSPEMTELREGCPQIAYQMPDEGNIPVTKGGHWCSPRRIKASACCLLSSVVIVLVCLAKTHTF